MYTFVRTLKTSLVARTGREKKSNGLFWKILACKTPLRGVKCALPRDRKRTEQSGSRPSKRKREFKIKEAINTLMDHSEITQRLIEHLHGMVDAVSFSSFVEPIQVTFLEPAEGLVVLEAPGAMSVNWINRNLTTQLGEYFENQLGCPVKVEVRQGKRKPQTAKTKSAPPQTVQANAVDDSPAPKTAKKNSSQAAKDHNDAELCLIQHYTFENYVVGKGNQLAYASALQVAESPGRGNPYNPLYIWSGPGLGKTHLLHAIAHAIHEKKPELVVRLLSAETFMHQFIEIIQQRKPFTDFRHKYRECDVLIIDDIQFVARGEATETEFFHTFNSLYEGGAQIIVASDQHPLKISSLQERMSTRLNWGLTIDINAPDFETRLSILKKKCELMDLQVPDHVLTRIAQRVKSDVRELQSALVKLSAHSKLIGKDLEEHVDELLTDMFPAAKGQMKLTGDEIINAVADEYEVAPSELKSSRRKKEIVGPRHVAMYMVREHTQLAFEGIGELFGGRNHATVLKASERVRKSPTSRQSLAIARVREKLGLYPED